MTKAQSLSERLAQVIQGLAVDHKQTKVLVKEPTEKSGYHIRLDGQRGAHVAIYAHGMKIVAIVTAAIDVLQNIILAIRAWCIGEDFSPLPV